MEVGICYLFLSHTMDELLTTIFGRLPIIVVFKFGLVDGISFLNLDSSCSHAGVQIPQR